MGARFSEVAPSYPGQASKASGLLTYPTTFMGIGNLIGMPLALAIGRRPILLATLTILVLTGVWCACSNTMDSHLAGRNIMALATGQSEALVPTAISLTGITE